MRWSALVAVALLGFLTLLVASRAHSENWTTTRIVGAGLFLSGVAIDTFLDEFIAMDSTLFPWLDAGTTGLWVVGFLVWWSSRRN